MAIRLFKKKTNPIQNDQWHFWDYYNDQEELVVVAKNAKFLEAERQIGATTEYCLYIQLPKDRLTQEQIPTVDFYHELRKEDDRLIALLLKNEVACRQVVRRTSLAEKLVVFEVKPTEAFERTVKEWQNTGFHYPLTWQTQRPWSTYNAIEPDAYDWQQIRNRYVYEQLVGNGSNPQMHHAIEHTFTGPINKLQELRQVYLSEGFKKVIIIQGRLEVIISGKLDLESIHPITYHFLETASDYDCDYRGWRAAIMK